jgi:predicted XRE-type DNA-binding protein
MAEIKSAFHVLGLDDAHELDLKADMVDRIGAIIKERGLTQARAGELMGLGQAEVSKMLGGHLDRFTVDRLIKALAALGERVRLTFEPVEVESTATSDPLAAAASVTYPPEFFTALGKKPEAPHTPARSVPTKARKRATLEGAKATTHRGSPKAKGDRA